MTYDDIKNLRSAVLEEIQEQFFGLPLTVEHHKLCEMRIQTIALLLNKNTLTDEIKGASSDIRVESDDMKDDRIKKHG